MTCEQMRDSIFTSPLGQAALLELQLVLAMFASNITPPINIAAVVGM